MDRPHPFRITLDGHTYYVRPLHAYDKDLLQKGFKNLSNRSRYFRFFAVFPELSEPDLKFFTEIDGYNHVAWGIREETDSEPIPVGICRFVRLKDEPEIAETAITVVDSYQGKGIGRVLLAVMNISAAHVGIKKFRNHVLAENHAVLKILHNLGVEKQQRDGSLILIETHVYPRHRDLSSDPKVQHFKEIMKCVEEKMSNSGTLSP